MDRTDMKDIKELALKVAKEMNWRMDEMTLETFATRLIAAYLAEQEPVAWVPQFSWQRSIDAVACSSKRSFDDIPLFTAPPEPTQAVESAIAQLVTALQQSKGWMRDYADSIIRDAIDRKTASSSEEVQSSLKWLRKAEFGAMQEYASRIADLIERLAARVPDDRIATLEKQRDELLVALELCKFDSLNMSLEDLGFIRSVVAKVKP